MRSKTKKPVERRNLEIFEDNNGDICIQGDGGGLLDLMHTIMSAVTDKENAKLPMAGRTLYIRCKEDNENSNSNR